MQRSYFPTAVIIIMLSQILLLAGCGGGSSSKVNANQVAQVTLPISTLSLNPGEVQNVGIPNAVNSTGGQVTGVTFTFNSSNPSVASVKGDGSVCGGTWDSTFVVCTGTNANGQPVTGTAIITATAQGVSSAPVTVSVHPVVTFITTGSSGTIPASGCLSHGSTLQFTATACSTQVTPHATSGACAPNAADITSSVLPFTWTTTDPTVATIDANGLATAQTGGIGGIVASVGAVTSPSTGFHTCMPVSLTLHETGDTNGPTESATMAVAATLQLEADEIDENGAFFISEPVSFLSNHSGIATINPGVSGQNIVATVTAVTPGGAGLFAVCAPPTCGNGINKPVYSNLFSVTVSGGSPATTVYAATSFAPPSGTQQTMIPIDTSKTPPAAGTPINLPGQPNSIIFTKDGSKGFIGTSSGLALLDTVAQTVTLIDGNTVGKVLAVSNNGTEVIISNAALEPSFGKPFVSDPASQRLFLVNVTSTGSTTSTFILPGAFAAAFDNASTKAYVAAQTGDGTNNVYVVSPFQSLQKLALPGSAIDATPLASGPLVFIADGTGLSAINVCDNSLAPAPAVNSPNVQLLGSVLNLNVIVALDATGVNLETVNVTPPASGFCPPNVASGNLFLDFGVGAFPAHRLLVSTNGNHVVALPVGINKVLVANLGAGGNTVSTIGLPAGATEPANGDLVLDGNTLWVGVAGTNTVDRIDLLAGADNLQIPTSFKQSDGTAAPPNIIGVKPH